MTQKTYGDYPEKKFSFTEDPDTYVIVRQASWGAERRLSQATTTGEMSWHEEGRRMYQVAETSVADQWSLQIYLTFVESNMLTDDGKSLFQPKMPEQMFILALDRLPSEVVSEWHDWVLEMNPDWDPKRSREERSLVRKGRKASPKPERE